MRALNVACIYCTVSKTSCVMSRVDNFIGGKYFYVFSKDSDMGILLSIVQKKKYSRNRPWRPIGL
jgi:hypothetical protein